MSGLPIHSVKNNQDDVAIALFDRSLLKVIDVGLVVVISEWVKRSVWQRSVERL